MIIKIQNGLVNGIKVSSCLEGKSYFSFIGIPYAKPPVGDLRFREPQPVDKWNGTWDATFERNPCIQLTNTGLLGSEDCLYLNVHIPSIPSKHKLKAVMVFIHGGSFRTGTGSSHIYSPDFLIDYGVIIVTFNYRLNIFGFLNLELSDCRGNMGLKDQLLALKWVHQNIKEFGGDPENITLFGCSAGATSIHYHILSDASKGLFRRAIMQSGTVLCPWSFTTKNMETAFQVGNILGYEGTDSTELLSWLKRYDAEELVKALNKHVQYIKNETLNVSQCYTFTPSIEIFKEGAFITDHPRKLLKNASPVPLIVGLNSKEGMAVLQEIPTTYDLDYLINCNLDFIEDDVLLSTARQKIRKFYFQDDIGPNMTLKSIDMFTDFVFRSFYESFRQHKGPVYVYNFVHDGNRNIYKQIITGKYSIKVDGAAHGDELGYLFNAPYLTLTMNKEDTKVIHNLCRLWTNFAKTGTPNDNSSDVVWKPSTTENPCHLKIDENLELINRDMNEQSFHFWSVISKL